MFISIPEKNVYNGLVLPKHHSFASCVLHVLLNGAHHIKVLLLFWEHEREAFVMESLWDGISAEYWWRRHAGLPAHTHRWTVCQGNLTHTDQRLPFLLTVGGNGTEREEEEQGKELITALMLHFIIVSWARLLKLITSAWLSTQRPLLLGLFPRHT